MSSEFLWYIPNSVETGHRGDNTQEGWGTLDFSSQQALEAERHGFEGALVGTGWGRPDTFTVSTAIAARTTSFKPLAAIRPGYWQPAHFACSAATLDQLSGGRLLVNIVSGQDDHRAYGDNEEDQPTRYARTQEFMHLVRKLWTEEHVSFDGQFFSVQNSTCQPRPFGAEDGRHPPLYFGGASAAAERVSAAEADVQLCWGEPHDMIAERLDRLKKLSAECERRRPLEFGLRITTVVRETTEQAWRDAEEKLSTFEEGVTKSQWSVRNWTATGQQRLLDLQEKGEVLDSCLWTAPGRVGGGGAATTWLVGSSAEVVAALEAYEALGVSHFILSDTPYLQEISRVGELVVSRMQGTAASHANR
jgi:alkanesulfonate monooxygenase